MAPSNFTSFITASRRRGHRALCSAGVVQTFCRGAMLGNADELHSEGTLVARSAHIGPPALFLVAMRTLGAAARFSACLARKKSMCIIHSR